MEKLRVGLLYGGRSAEHDISLMSARCVLRALDPGRFEAVPVAVGRDGRFMLQNTSSLLSAATVEDAGAGLTQLPPGALGQQDGPAAVDVVFPVLHGTYGEDGTMQGLLELAGLPYVGAGVLGSAVGMDKDVMKRLLRDAGLPVTAFEVLRLRDLARAPQAAQRLGYPLFVKPANLGSSVGVSRVETAAQLMDAVKAAFAFDDKILLEAAVTGVELECSVLGNDHPRPSCVGAIHVTHPDGFYSYDAKYMDERGAVLEIPAHITPAQAARVQHLSLRAFEVLECAGFARVDFFLRDDGEILINEINTLPGFTAMSMVPRLWAHSGVPVEELVTTLLELALERHARRRALKTTRV